MLSLISLYFPITVATNVSLKSHQPLVAELSSNHSFQNKAVFIKAGPRHRVEQNTQPPVREQIFTGDLNITDVVMIITLGFKWEVINEKTEKNAAQKQRKINYYFYFNTLTITQYLELCVIQ